MLFVNGLTLLGRIEPKGGAPVNALVGAVLVGNAARLGAAARAPTRPPWPARPASCCSAITYLWVALNAWTGHDPKGLGWYFAWATGVSVFLGLVALVAPRRLEVRAAVAAVGDPVRDVLRA